ncbi:MAG: ABC transporter permease [Gemmatimonadetes bacterium]|nr:ABC transporter permease [Gemmatimonadota bacterium]
MPLDLTFAWRSLTRARGFSIAVVLTLALGIGANTAIFSVLRGVVLRPLPHQDGDRLMYLRQSADGPGAENIAFSVPEIEDLRTGSKTLAQIAEYSPMTLNVVDESDAYQLDVGLVTGNYLSVMGLRPILGRPFNAGDDGAGAAPVVLLTHAFWTSRFSSDSAVVGRTMRIGGRSVEVIGVLQPAPFFPGRIDALMNMSISEHHVSALMIQGRTHRMTEVIARLTPGASVDQARSEVATIRQRVQATYPEVYDKASNYTVSVTPFREVLGQNARTLLGLLIGVAAFILVIGCANVANLTLMRTVRREQELNVRAALGAGTLRLRRLLLIENLSLSLAGAVLGIGLAIAGVRLLSTIAARVTPRASEIQVDGAVLAFSLLLAIGVAVLLALVPGVTQQTDLGAGLSAGNARSSGGIKRRRLQRALVVLQVAVTVVLLTGTGLLVRSMQRLAAVDPGLDARDVLTMEVPRDFTSPEANTAIRGRYEAMQRELSTLPGVQVVGVGSTMPLRAADIVLDVKAEGRPLAPNEAVPRAEYRAADPGYFRASGIALRAGRDFAATDGPDGAKVVIVNKALADHFFPDVDPIGRRIAWTGDVLRFIGVSDEWRTIVGVVGNTRDGGLDAAPVPVVFVPFAQGDFPTGGLVLRTNVPAPSVATAARAIVRSLAPQQPIENVMTVDAIRDESVGPRRLNATLVGAFGTLALILAAVGIAAVLAFAVSTRTTEVGIRMSLGATPGSVRRMVLNEGGALVAIGLALGTIGSLALAGIVRGFLFEVQPYDPLTLVAVAGLMLVIGIAASWLPAARACRIQPSEALRRG